MDIIDGAAASRAGKTLTTDRVYSAAMLAGVNHLTAGSAVDELPSTNIGWTTGAGRRQLPFLQQQQLTQLW
jgi:hypothetical protein